MFSGYMSSINPFNGNVNNMTYSMNAARMGEPEKAVSALLMDKPVRKCRYISRFVFLMIYDGDRRKV